MFFSRKGSKFFSLRMNISISELIRNVCMMNLLMSKTDSAFVTIRIVTVSYFLLSKSVPCRYHRWIWLFVSDFLVMVTQTTSVHGSIVWLNFHLEITYNHNFPSTSFDSKSYQTLMELAVCDQLHMYNILL